MSSRASCACSNTAEPNTPANQPRNACRMFSSFGHGVCACIPLIPSQNRYSIPAPAPCHHRHRSSRIAPAGRRCQHESMTDVCAIPAFRDNYIWLLVGEGAPPPVVIVDPGDAAPVLAALRHLDLRPTTLFITHHHRDPVGGLATKRDANTLDVYGPANETNTRPRPALSDGDRVAQPGLPAV